MAVAAGIDVAKETHWAVIKSAATGEVLASHAVDNSPAAIGELIGELQAAGAVHGDVTAGIDILGGVAGLLQAMLAGAGLRVVHVPGLAVARARRATTGGANKSDPRDAAVIADQIRTRDDLRVIGARSDADAGLRLLTARRTELVADQTRRACRIRDLLASVFPGLERQVDVTGKAGLHLLTRYVTPGQIRAAGHARLAAHLRRAGHLRHAGIDALAAAALAAAREQSAAVPGEDAAASLIREHAAEALAARAQLKAIDARIRAALDAHPDADLIRTLPGMGTALTAEFLAITGGTGRYRDGGHLAAAAGLAPVLRQSGKVRYLQRPTAGDKALKRVFYQSAFIATSCDPASRAYYRRKRDEGKTHHQAVIALARRRVSVLHAMLRNRTPYQAPQPAAAA
jgi:transposase